MNDEGKAGGDGGYTMSLIKLGSWVGRYKRRARDVWMEWSGVEWSGVE
jgi:hypothetical protein